MLGAIHSESRAIPGGDAALNATGLLPEGLEAKVRAAGPGYPLAEALDIVGDQALDHGVFVEAVLAQAFNLNQPIAPHGGNPADHFPLDLENRKRRSTGQGHCGQG